MYGLMELLITRLEALTSTQALYHKPSGTRIPPQIINTAMLPNKADWKEAEFFPFVRAALFKGGFDGITPQPHKIVLVNGIYTPGDIAAGTADIVALTLAVGGIVKNRSFPPFVLATPVPYTIGPEEQGMEGMQPHPFHFSKIILDFIKT